MKNKISVKRIVQKIRKKKNRIKVSKIFKFVQIALIIISIVFVLYLLLGRVVNWDLDSINTVTQMFMTIATFAAVYVAIEPSKRKLELHFYMKYNTAINKSLANTRPKIFITNPSNRTIIIHKVAIFAKKLDLMYVNLLSQDITRPQIETIDGNDFSKVQPIIVVPNQTIELALSVKELNYVFGHHIDQPDKSNKDWLLRIEITDIKGQITKLKTEITFGKYYHDLISILNDIYKETEAVGQSY